MFQRFLQQFLSLITVILSFENAKSQNAVLSGGGESNASAFGSFSVSFGEAFANPFETSVSVLGKSGVQHNFEWLYPWMRLKATINYKNLQNSPLSAIHVSLKDSLGTVIANGTTNSVGLAEFGFVPDGVYSVEYSDNIPWNGVNGTDALLINRSFTGYNLLNGLYSKAGDVNNNLVLSNADALSVMRRVAGYSNAFLINDRIYSVNQIQVQRQAGQVDTAISSEALFAGDVNGSYLPGQISRTEWQTLSTSQKITPSKEEFEWIISAGRTMQMGAATLFLQIPSGLMVTNIWSKQNSNNQHLVFRQEGNLIRLIWFSPDAWSVSQNEELFVLNVVGNAEGPMMVDMKQSELADPVGKPLDNWKLWSYELSQTDQMLWSAFLYPNPIENQSSLNLSLRESGFLYLKVFDYTGRNRLEEELYLTKGSHSIPFKFANNLSTGCYTLQVLFKGSPFGYGIPEFKQIKFIKR